MTAGFAERQGAEAFRLGLPLSANPYQDKSLVGYSWWRQGWTKAEKDQDDDNVEVQFREPKRWRCSNCGFTGMHSDACSIGQVHPS